MKKRTVLLSLLTVLLLACLLVGCGAAVPKTYQADLYAGAEQGDPYAKDMGEQANTGTLTQNRKIIRNIYMSIQTKEFDALLDKIEAQITALGGYIESSDITGNGFDTDNKRSASMTVRIPSQSGNAFSAYISENSTVTNKSVTAEDVTSRYVDTESRLSALRAEKTSLETLLSQATEMEDILSIRSQLTDVIYEIESYQTQLNAYDNQVDYATVSLSIREVDREQVVVKQSVWQQIGVGFVESLENVGVFFRGLFVGLVSWIPYLAIVALFALPLAIILPLVKRGRKKRAQTKSQPPQE